MDRRDIASCKRNRARRPLKPGCACVFLIAFWAMTMLQTDARSAEAMHSDSWSVVQGEDPHSGKESCLLVSRHIEMPDGYGTAQVQLIFGQQALMIRTDSNLDPAYPDQGIRVDEGRLIPPEPPFPFQRQNAVFEVARDQIVDEFRRGREAELALGFWPTWPMTRTQRATISLLGFSDAHDALPDCERGQTRSAAQ
jgi:hypothetical protein